MSEKENPHPPGCLHHAMWELEESVKALCRASGFSVTEVLDGMERYARCLGISARDIDKRTRK